MTTGEVKELVVPQAGEVLIIPDEINGAITIVVKDKYTILLKDVTKLYYEFVRKEFPPHDDEHHHEHDDVPQ
jgi:hypothetical protein